MAPKTVRRSISMTREMHDLLTQLVTKRGREVREVDLIREAIRHYLDDQAQLVSSRRHFQKTLRERIGQLEAALTFQLNVLICLVAHDEAHLRDAIIAARQDGETLLAQMKAVRELKESDP